MKQTKSSIKKAIKEMQEYQKESKDMIESRIVYAMSEVLRWAIEDTVDWESPLKQAISNAKILKDDLK